MLGPFHPPPFSTPLQVRSSTELGDRQMAALFPAVLSAFRSGVDEVALPLMPFLHAYTARLKVQQKRCGMCVRGVCERSVDGTCIALVKAMSLGECSSSCLPRLIVFPPSCDRNQGTLPAEALGHVRAILEGLAFTSRWGRAFYGDLWRDRV